VEDRRICMRRTRGGSTGCPHPSAARTRPFPALRLWASRG